ncbi:MAG TPA: CrcB family protein [Tepidisphaeraceae bacterium]|nr:CrcB family protein [Tepidisphaeraceae bacterium]
MNMALQYLAVGVAGFFGAIARFAIGTLCAYCFGPGFPVGTMIINLSGSFFLGWFLTAAGNRFVVTDTLRIAIGVGFVGAYTTFSTLMFDSASLARDGALLKAGFNLAGSMVLGMIAVWAGITLACK